MRIVKAIRCWFKGFAYGPDGQTWYTIKTHLLHPSWNLGKHDDEEVNQRVVDGRKLYDYRCKSCGRISEDWMKTEDMSQNEVIDMMAGLAAAADADLTVTPPPTKETK